LPRDGLAPVLNEIEQIAMRDELKQYGKRVHRDSQDLNNVGMRQDALKAIDSQQVDLVMRSRSRHLHDDLLTEIGKGRRNGTLRRLWWKANLFDGHGTPLVCA